MDKMAWVDEKNKEMEENRSGEYFNVVEGDNRVQLLTHCEPLAQVWDGQKYRVAEDGDKNVSIKGVCWVLQDGVIKSAKLPYTVVKSIRELQNDPDYAFTEFPMPRLINIKTKNAGSKEVEYTVIPSPKETPVSDAILAELKKKPTPEELVERAKGKVSQAKDDYPEEDIDTSMVPF